MHYFILALFLVLLTADTVKAQPYEGEVRELWNGDVIDIYNQSALPHERFACNRGDITGLCVRQANWRSPQPQLFVPIAGKTDQDRTPVLEGAELHRRFSKSVVGWAPVIDKYPEGADRSPGVRHALWAKASSSCKIFAANRLRHTDLRFFGWLRTFIHMGNNVGRDYFYGLDIWNGHKNITIHPRSNDSLRLEAVIPQNSGAWVVYLVRRRTHEGAFWSASEWKNETLKAQYFGCGQAVNSPIGIE